MALGKQFSHNQQGFTSDDGLYVRNECIKALTSDRVAVEIRKIADGIAASSIGYVLPDNVIRMIFTDMLNDVGWREEFWVLDKNENVHLSNKEDFFQAAANRRFSWNDCLRKPAINSWCLRGFLSSLISADVKESLSTAYGASIRFRSADIARYNNGHYLRRHADLFDDRRFGLVWFFSKNWRPVHGGQLIVEGADGASTVISPESGTLGFISILQGYYHQVASINSSDWARYSIATHFHDDTL